MNSNQPFHDPQKQDPNVQNSTNGNANNTNPYLHIPPYMRGSYTPTPKEKPQYRGMDTLFAWLSIAVGFLFVRAMPVTQNSLGGMLFLLVLYAFGGLYLYGSGVRLGKASLLLAVVVLILSFGMITGGNHTLRGLLFLGLLLAFLYWCYVTCGLGNMANDNAALYIWRAVFVMPFLSLEHIFPALFSFRKKGENAAKLWRTLGWTLVGLGVAVIPTAIVIALLSYDAQFTSLMDRIFSFSLDGAWELIRDLILGFLVAIVLFGVLFAVNYKRKKNNGQPEEVSCADLHVLPRALLCAAVTPILAVYVIFFISQWSYYVSAFTNVLPADLTYAAYAREGFFQLCGVSALNAAMLLLFNLLIRKNGKPRDVIRTLYSSVISVFTLILIATAISKMALYINTYGLTQKRVYATWFMLLLAVVFVLVLIRQATKKLRLFPAIALVCVLFAALITLPNVDGMIASYNVNAYLSGDLKEVDVDALSGYGTSSVPALVRLRDELTSQNYTDDTVKELLKQTDQALTLIDMELREQPKGFFTFNFPDARAEKLLP